MGTLFSDKAKLSKPQGQVSSVNFCRQLHLTDLDGPGLISSIPVPNLSKSPASQDSHVICKSTGYLPFLLNEILQIFVQVLEESHRKITNRDRKEEKKGGCLPNYSHIFTCIYIYIIVYVYTIYYIILYYYCIFGLCQQTGSRQSDSSSNISTKTHWVYLQR